MNRLFVLITTVVSLIGCAYQPIKPPQEFELCTNYAVYDNAASYRHYNPTRKGSGHYNRWDNKAHVVRNDWESWGHEAGHAATIKGWPKPLEVGPEDGHFYNFAKGMR